MTISGSAALPPSPNLSNVRARGALQSRPKIETVSMPIFEPRMNKDFTLGSAHEDESYSTAGGNKLAFRRNDHDQAYCVFRRYRCDFHPTSGGIARAARRGL